MEVLVVKAYFPLFSIRQFETYQVAVSYPFIPPSTIVGALGRGLAEVGRCAGAQCLEEARRLVKKARDSAGDAVKTAVVLKRARGVLEDRRMPVSEKELRSFSDALLREYVVAVEKSILVIPHGDLDVLVDAAWHVERFGDSESIASVKVEVARAEKCDGGGVNVVVDLEEAEGGLFTVYTAWDEKGARKDFAAPVASVGNPGVFKAGKVEVKGGVYCVGNLKFPASWI